MARDLEHRFFLQISCRENLIANIWDLVWHPTLSTVSCFKYRVHREKTNG